MPNQHGAWAMLVVPVLVGALHAGARWWHLLLLVTWLVAYLAFYATGLWLKAHRKARYRPPVLAYGAATTALGVATLAAQPSLLRWAVVYAPLLAVSLWFSWRRDERSLANGLVTVAAACLMAVVAHAPAAPGSTAFPGWLPGGGAEQVWVVAGVLFGYFAGTVFYVKTMIRERGNRGMYVTSVAYHGVTTIVVALASPWLGGLFALLAARAAVVPRTWPTATPRTIGYGEIVASVVLAVMLVTLV
ncbi:YwiC-like family protein [Cellulomonas sp. KRMCY2]|uniref:YwiC-like family protein n=1 Tax=Cellulomonas sp. KRMCY2 TaxID=1304865 RepID=UPI00045E5986|nr:YwiC-like family protein [Cellulomonas sp. KRMCY2]